MDREKCLPGEPVIWCRVKKGTYYTGQKIKAEVYYRTPHRIAIRFKNPQGNPMVKYVPSDQLEPAKS